MNGSLKYSAAVGINLPGTYPAPFKKELLQNVEEAARCGCSYVELHVRTPQMVDAAALNRSCAENGMRVSSISTGMGFGAEGLSMIDDDPEVRRKARERLEGMIDLAGEIGSAVIIGLLRGRVPDLTRYSLYEDRLTENLLILLEKAEKANVDLDLEAIAHIQCNYFNSSAQVLDYVKRIGNPRLKILLDTYHMNLEERDTFGCVAECGSWLRYIHYSDSNRRRPGSGNFDYVAMTRALRKIGFNGVVGLEYIPTGDASEEFKKTLKYLRAIETMLDSEE